MAVRAQDEFPCAHCDYPLRGLTAGALCPECGTPVLESLRATPERLRTSGLAITSMVLGIISVAGCIVYGLPSIFCGPGAIVFWWLAKREINEMKVGGASKGIALAGLITGILGTLLGGLALFFIISVFSALGSPSFNPGGAPPPVQAVPQPSPSGVPGTGGGVVPNQP